MIFNLECGSLLPLSKAAASRRTPKGTLSDKRVKQGFDAMWNQEGTADELIAKRGLKQVTDTGAIEKIVDDVIAQNPAQVAGYRAGNDKLFGCFVAR